MKTETEMDTNGERGEIKKKKKNRDNGKKNDLLNSNWKLCHS